MTRANKSMNNFSPKYLVMGFLYIRPMHGYELDKQLRLSLHEVWRIPQSQTYNILKNLEKENLVSTTHQEQEKRPDKDLLTLTSRGRAEFENWLFTPTPGRAKAIRVEFITRLFFAAHLSESLPFQIIREQADAIRACILDLKTRFALTPVNEVFNHMGLELRISQLEATLDWVEQSTKYFEENEINFQ